MTVAPLPSAFARPEREVRRPNKPKFNELAGFDSLKAKLPTRYVEILEAEASSYEDLRKKLGLKLNTVKSRLHRARAMLNALKGKSTNGGATPTQDIT